MQASEEDQLHPNSTARYGIQNMADSMSRISAALLWACMYRGLTIWRWNGHGSSYDSVLAILTILSICAAVATSRAANHAVQGREDDASNRSPGPHPDWKIRSAPFLACVYGLAWACFKVTTGRRWKWEDVVFIAIAVAAAAPQAIRGLKRSKAGKDSSSTQGQCPLESHSEMPRQPKQALGLVMTTGARTFFLLMAALFAAMVWGSGLDLSLTAYILIGVFAGVSFLGGTKYVHQGPGSGSSSEVHSVPEAKLADPASRPEAVGSFWRRGILLLELVLIALVFRQCKTWFGPDSLAEWRPIFIALQSNVFVYYWYSRSCCNIANLEGIAAVFLAGIIAGN